MFSTLPKTDLNFLVAFVLSSANAFNLVQSKILFGKELKHIIFVLYRLKSNKVKHERVHENFRPYTCDTCGQAFSRRIYLETHQYKHTGIFFFYFFFFLGGGGYPGSARPSLRVSVHPCICLCTKYKFLSKR